MEERKKTPLSKFFDFINTLENVLVGVSLTGIFATVILQIAGRVSNHPFPWTEETTRYLFLWMMFIALASGFNKAESSRVTIFLNFSPRWMKRFSKLLYAVIVFGFFVFMAVYGVGLVRQQISLREMGTALPISMALIGVCVPISGVLGLIGTLQSFMEYPKNIEIPEKPGDGEPGEGGTKV